MVNLVFLFQCWILFSIYNITTNFQEIGGREKTIQQIETIFKKIVITLDNLVFKNYNNYLPD